ncbi:hypothetical protein [Sinorhizobium fredii]|uniref:hypothetical protein n=1 Tax=Rhizobium fredii TaxID=380 RepID=UPI00351417CC
MDQAKVVSGINPVEPTGLHWLNPFSGEIEPWYNADFAVVRQLQAAAKRIAELQEQIDELKSGPASSELSNGR